MRRKAGRSHILFLTLLFASLLLFLLPDEQVSSLRGRALSAVAPMLNSVRDWKPSQNIRPASLEIPTVPSAPTAAPVENTSQLAQFASEIDRLRAENISLRSDNMRLHSALPGAGAAPMAHPGLHADVISRRVLWQEPILAINRGSAHGIHVHAGVLHRNAVLGRIADVGPGAATVALTTHRGVSIAARLVDCRQEGVLQGMASVDGSERLCRMQIVGRECLAKEGEQIVTSGFDGAFPAGLWLGTVVKVAKSADIQWEITVRPACDESRVESVQVLTVETPAVPWPEMPILKRRN
jgi:cell shape-determining protein MreC